MATALESLRRLAAVQRAGTLAELCVRQGIELLVLFGSAVEHYRALTDSTGPRRARRQDPGDIDVALAFRHDVDGDLLRVIDDLAQLVPGDHLDVMDLSMAGPVALHRALTSCQVLYARTPEAFAERQIFAINHYIETAPLRRAVLESLSR